MTTIRPALDDSSQQPKLLVVDDDPRLLESLSQLLQASGFVVDAAQGGRAACRQIEAQSYDLVLLDMRMPDMNGLQVLAYLQKAQIDVPVVVVSGEASFGTVSKALRRGAYDYIKKPYIADELIATVRSVLRKRMLERAHADVQHRLKKSEELHRYIVNSSPDIVFMLDQRGRFCFLNSKVESLLGYGCGELMGRHYRTLIHDQDLPKASWAFSESEIGTENPRNLELRLKTRGSRKANRHFEVTVFPIEGPAQSPNGATDIGAGSNGTFQIYGIARDITERKEAEAFITFQAYHDLLTRLPNRALFKDRLTLAITQAKRSKQKLAVMFLDLDRFKVVNDTLGHAMGDRLLQAVAQRLESCLRRGDTLSRFGGDEFTLLLPAIAGEEDASLIANKLIEALKAPFKLGDHEVFVGISIGIAMFPTAGKTLEDLIQHADVAMYHVKGRGKDDFQFYVDTMNVDTSNRLSLERDLRRALEQQELRVYYQPQMCARTGRLMGVEALVRWQHPELGLLYPRDFLPLAEETKLIGDLSEWVLKTACEELQPWIAKYRADTLRLSVNVSPMQVEHPNFVDSVLKLVDGCNFPADHLEIEITESMIMNDLEQISRKLGQLADRGVRIAIDDFGTGYSSLNYIHRLPIHTLKVDQSFVRDIRRGDDGACIVNAIVAMAKGLQLQIIAEGVETETQLQYLRDLGCHEVQGFFYGAARPLSELAQYLPEQKAAQII
ncbi:putative bifunctional diguanylate cyclase/phosphodiesterase [Hydrocarboniclastica marina]|uniref:cyclic-guanylate-specific phosphodiesterase n=1 Tax=Hydrocarboniclastica marina TaxID=2259620 RepID=A0A4P7XF72_9ALTE|nr:EAL domain-containing protein [Hydrocarboniclastica marina]QCF25315.1 EAL domain-containing protein [Hydrocarboniclastica marina]